MSQTIAREALALGAAADFSIVSFGSCSRDFLTSQHGLLGEPKIEELIESGAVGNIPGMFFDATGALVSSPLNRRTPSIPIEAMRESEFVLLAAGLGKRDALLAVLRSGIINRLIVDGDLALAALDDTTRHDMSSDAPQVRGGFPLFPDTGASTHSGQIRLSPRASPPGLPPHPR